MKDIITLAHGGGGRAMSDLIESTFLRAFGQPEGDVLEDQARFDLGQLARHGDRLAFTTDSYVLDPLFIPGGDIGTLAVAGTVNDLAVGGAVPLYLSCSVIIEEGLPIETLRRVVDSMAATAATAGVKIVTGDTKVVTRGAADKLFINTSGVGVIPSGVNISAARAQPGDVVIVNGYVGDHGAAVVDARGELALESEVKSDCQALNSLVQCMLQSCEDIHCMRDATRGGIATVLNEFANAGNGGAGVGIRLIDGSVPVRDEVRGVCEILGLDPLYLANEGKLVAVVPAESAESLLKTMREHPDGRDSAIIGEIQPSPAGRVVLQTTFGGQRILDKLVSEQLPRIC